MYFLQSNVCTTKQKLLFHAVISSCFTVNDSFQALPRVFHFAKEHEITRDWEISRIEPRIAFMHMYASYSDTPAWYMGQSQICLLF